MFFISSVLIILATVTTPAYSEVHKYYSGYGHYQGYGGPTYYKSWPRPVAHKMHYGYQGTGSGYTQSPYGSYPRQQQYKMPYMAMDYMRSDSFDAPNPIKTAVDNLFPLALQLLESTQLDKFLTTIIKNRDIQPLLQTLIKDTQADITTFINEVVDEVMEKGGANNMLDIIMENARAHRRECPKVKGVIEKIVCEYIPVVVKVFYSPELRKTVKDVIPNITSSFFKLARAARIPLENFLNAAAPKLLDAADSSGLLLVVMDKLAGMWPQVA